MKNNKPRDQRHVDAGMQQKQWPVVNPKVSPHPGRPTELQGEELGEDTAAQ